MDDDDGSWITTENGHHVHLNEEGVPDKGNPHVIAAMEGKSGSGKTTLQEYREHKWGESKSADHEMSQKVLQSGDKSAIANKISDDLETLGEYDDDETINGILSDYYATGSLDDILDQADDLDLSVSPAQYRSHPWGDDEEADNFMGYRTIAYGSDSAVRAKISDDCDTLSEFGSDPSIAKAITEPYRKAGKYGALKRAYIRSFDEWPFG